MVGSLGRWAARLPPILHVDRGTLVPVARAPSPRDGALTRSGAAFQQLHDAPTRALTADIRRLDRPTTRTRDPVCPVLSLPVWTRPGSLAATTGFADAFSTQVLRCFSSPLGLEAAAATSSRPPGRGVAPFGHPRISACDAAPRGLSWRATTFFAPSAPEASPVCRFSLFPVKLSRSTINWWAEVDSNHRPPAYQAGALTTALSARHFRISPTPDFSESVPENHIVMVPLPRKEVIQPHLPIRLPCYDFTPITDPTVDGTLLPQEVGSPGFGCDRLSWCDGRCVQGPGTNSPPHADGRLLAIPASCRRVAACNPN